MSADKMTVDYDDLAQLETRLTKVVNVLNSELEATAVLAANCGDAGLGVKIIAFGQSWNKHRFDIRDTLEWLRDSVKNIHTTLEETDATLAAGLTAPATPTPTPGPSPTPK